MLLRLRHFDTNQYGNFKSAQRPNRNDNDQPYGATTRCV